MAKARTTTATTVEEPIVEQNVETTAVVEEPQTVSEEPTENTTEGTTEEGNGENTSQTPVEGDNNGTTTNNTNSTKITNPKTGDNIIVWVNLMVISLLGIFTTIKLSKKI